MRRFARLRKRVDNLGFVASVLRSTGLGQDLHPTRWPRFARAVRGAKIGPHLTTMFHAINNPDKEALVEYGTINAADLALIHHTDSVDDAYEWIVGQLVEKALGQPGPML